MKRLMDSTVIILLNFFSVNHLGKDVVRQPRHMTTNGVDLLYVADRDRNTIHVFNYDGKHIRDLSHGLSTSDVSMAYFKQGFVNILFFVALQQGFLRELFNLSNAALRFDQADNFSTKFIFFQI